MSVLQPRSQFISLGPRRIHLLEWGEEMAPPLLLVHGIRDHAHSWDWFSAKLAKRFRVIAPDLRGHGDSDWAGAYNMPDYVRDLAGVISALDLSAIALVGHSLGGHIALRYAACFPELINRLCVIEGVELPIVRDQRRTPRPYPERLREWIDRETARENRTPRYYATPDEATQRMQAEHPAIDPGIIAHNSRHGLTHETGLGWRWKYDNASRFRAPEDAQGIDLDEILRAICCPVLLAYGDASWIPHPPPERLAMLRQHGIVAFPGAGHWLHQERRLPFLAALNKFLDSVTPCQPDESI
jgi:pimeloyl-ACP methyl ester carboxylesterase